MIPATGADLTYTTTSSFGVVCTYTSSRATDFYFDNFYVGAIIPDTIAPTIASATAIDSLHLDVKFSKPVDSVSSETTTNYAVNNGIGIPMIAVLDTSDLSLVHLTLSIPFTNAASYILTVNNIKDYANNMIALIQPHHSLILPSSLCSHLILSLTKSFHMLNPAGVQFVEIYNASQNTIDLSQLSFTRRDLTTGVLDAAVVLSSTSLLFSSSVILHSLIARLL